MSSSLESGLVIAWSIIQPEVIKGRSDISDRSCRCTSFLTRPHHRWKQTLSSTLSRRDPRLQALGEALLAGSCVRCAVQPAMGDLWPVPPFCALGEGGCISLFRARKLQSDRRAIRILRLVAPHNTAWALFCRRAQRRRPQILLANYLGMPLR